MSSSDRLADAFAELCIMCRPRPDMKDGNMAAAAVRVFKICAEYDEPIALAALDLWPRRSEWFPTEYELRMLLEEVKTEAAIGAHAREHVGGGRYNMPVGQTVQFVRDVERLRGDGYVKSWLRGGVTAQFSNAKVYTTGIGADRLMKDLGDLAKLHGVEIIHDPDVSAMLKAYCEQNGLTFDNKPKRGR